MEHLTFEPQLSAILPGAVAQTLICLLSYGLARALGLRLGKTCLSLAIAVPWLVLAPWFFGSRLLVPCDVLRGLPGAPQVSAPDNHDLLNDAVFQFLPWETEVRRAFAEGRLPLWSDALDGGSSPWVNPQAGALSPISMLARMAPLRHWLLVALLLKMTLAIAGAWALMRSLGAPRAACALMAAGYGLGGAIMPWALFPHSRAAAWLPWLVVGAVRSGRCPRGGPIAATALITACMALAGHPEVAVAGGVLAGTAAIWTSGRGGGLGRLCWKRIMVGPAAAALLGLAMAGCQLLPFVYAMSHSDRAAEGERRGIPAQEVRWHSPSSWFLGNAEQILLAPLSPNAYGRPFHDSYDGPANWPESGAGYAGVVALAGVAGLLLGLRRWRLAVPFALIAALFMILAAWFLPLLEPVIWMPLFRVLAYRRLLIISSLCICVLGSLGLQRLLGSTRPRAAIGAVVVVAACSIMVAPGPRVIAVWMLILAAVILARQSRAVAMSAMALALVVDLVPWAWSMLPAGHRELFYPRIAIIDQIKQAAPDPMSSRATAAGRLLPASLLPAYGIAEARPHNPMAPAAQRNALQGSIGLGERYFPRIERPRHPMMDFLNVNAAVVSAGAWMPERFVCTALDDASGMRICSSREALPRIFLARQVDQVPAGALADWFDSQVDPGRVAVLPESLQDLEPEPGPAYLALGGPFSSGSLVAVGDRPGLVRLEVRCEQPRVLASSLPFPEGWMARDTANAKQPLPRLVVNGAFFGALISPGARTIELRFIPPGLWAGLIASVVGCSIWLGLVAGSANWRRRR